MVKIREPSTLVKTGIFNGNLEKAVKKFNPNMQYLSLGLGNTNKYGIFDVTGEPYLLIIAQQKNKIINSEGYNTSLSITSYEEERNLEIYKKFRNLSRIELNVEPPEWFRESLQLMNFTFPIFEKNPKAAMDFLKSF